MIKRRFWLERIEKAWAKRSIVWLKGVRRAGKTTLCQSFDNIEYFDCERPRTRQLLEDAEAFLESLGRKRVVLDEIHRLNNPSELLKIAADHFPKIQILATGSSSLSASTKFKDTLTGRKTNLWLTPMNWADLADFSHPGWKHRLLHGGLPPFFLDSAIEETEYQEWLDDYWAKDIQELFRLERRSSFLKFVELILAQSGGLFEATAFAGPCEVSRTTIANFLSVLEETNVAHVIRPFSTHKPTEIISMPKVFGFDTGFVTYFRGWTDLRPDDLGGLWEHLVLNEIQSLSQEALKIRYWRDKQDHEVDFILEARGKKPVAIECKWSSKNAETKNLAIFRRHYPQGENWMICSDVERPFEKRVHDLKINFIGLPHLANAVAHLI